MNQKKRSPMQEQALSAALASIRDLTSEEEKIAYAGRLLSAVIHNNSKFILKGEEYDEYEEAVHDCFDHNGNQHIAETEIEVKCRFAWDIRDVLVTVAKELPDDVLRSFSRKLI